MIDGKTMGLLAAACLSLAACSTPPGPGVALPPPSTQQFSDPAPAADAEPTNGKAFDMDDDGKVSAGEAVGGVVAVGALIAICPFCVLGM